MSRVARVPLSHQPGEVWHYGFSVDVLARVVEVASGQPFDRFLDNRLFKPLGMVDTGFWVPPEKLHRLVDPPAGDAEFLFPDRDVTKPTTMFSGGGGLVSTAADYLRFCQMLLNGGELDGARILLPATVKLMTTSALPDGVHSAAVALGWTFGLGFAVRDNAASSWVPGSVGSFSWSGVWGTWFWVDPAEQLTAVQLIHATGNFEPVWNSLPRHDLRRHPDSRSGRTGVSAADRSSRTRIFRGHLQIRIGQFARLAQRIRGTSASMSR